MLYDGQLASPPEQIPLRAGPLTLVYEHGDLRYIRHGAREIIRRIYMAVRDRNWGTPPPVLSDVQLDAGERTFRISYRATHRQNELDFVWRAEISGDESGTISFSMDGQARSTFLRNRIGFCVLHPMRECAGAAARIEHVDGTVDQSIFSIVIAPQLIVNGIIQPHPPFAEMRALTHQVAPEWWAELRFAGETFELEDQRNWIDGSYKTYGTPLRLPFPVAIQAGTTVQQSVTLGLRGQGSGVGGQASEPNAASSSVCVPSCLRGSPTPDPSVQIAIPAPQSVAGKLPQIGLAMASHGQPLSALEIERLRALNLAHLRVDLHLADAAYPDTLRRAAAESNALGVPLAVALFFSAAIEDEIRDLASQLESIQPAVCAWWLFDAATQATGAHTVALARPSLAAYRPNAAIGGGTNVYFTDLNRTPLPLAALDMVCYSVNPQVHAFDNASLAETPPALAETVRSARLLSGDRPIAVTPITLRPRFNPVATNAAPLAADQLPLPVDPRQMSLLGAGWTLASLRYLAESAAASATYYETSGWRGVMETSAGAPLPDQFRSIAGAVFPLYHVLADAGAFAGCDVLHATSSDTLRVEVLALRKNDRVCVLLANMSAIPQQLRVHGLGAQVQLHLLDERNAEAAMRAPEAFRAQPGEARATASGVLELTLLPYALARIAW